MNEHKKVAWAFLIFAVLARGIFHEFLWAVRQDNEY